MSTVFLDANVLFSAAYKPGSRLAVLWDLRGVNLLSSAYAVEEARRNLGLARPGQLPAFERLIARTSIVPEAAADVTLPEGIALADKDRPILAAAVSARATHLLTGDKDHFTTLFGTCAAGVLIMTPSTYLQSRIG